MSSYTNGRTLIVTSNALIRPSASLIWKTITFPWSLFLGMLSTWATFLLSVFSAIGAAPKGYVSQAIHNKVQIEIDAMHIREDKYRSLIIQLKEQIEEKELDKKKALKKLRSTTHQLEELEQQRHRLLGGSERSPMLDSPYRSTTPSSSRVHHQQQQHPSFLLSKTSMHIASWLTALCIFTAYHVETCPSVHKKVLQLATYMWLLMYPVTYKEWLDWMGNPLMLGFNVFVLGYIAALALT